MKLLKVILVVIVLLAVLAGCAPGPNSMAGQPDGKGRIAGFWTGLWHGFASPVMFVISLFNKSIEVFETHNNGGWYSFGFLIGAGAILGGSGRGSAGRRRRSRQDY
jgi:hypothetical protein